MILPNLCLNCFAERRPESSCERCGWLGKPAPEVEGQLPPGSFLHHRYVVGEPLGRGGFSITYRGWDTRLERLRAIKEYFPAGVVTREGSQSRVSIVTGQSVLYSEGIQKYLAEARVLARFEGHPCIVFPTDFFEENATAYLVMEYLQGETLRQYVTRHGARIPYEHAVYFLTPVLHALSAVHEARMLHRDVSPDNVFLTVANETKLLDFGAARQPTSNQSAAMTVIIRDHYAPPEQYSETGKQGTWTDVYAFAATFYYALTGESPPSALARLMNDEIRRPSELGARLPRAAESILMRALAIQPKDRPGIHEMLHALLAPPQPAAAAKEGGVEEPVGISAAPLQVEAEPPREAAPLAVESHAVESHAVESHAETGAFETDPMPAPVEPQALVEAPSRPDAGPASSSSVEHSRNQAKDGVNPQVALSAFVRAALGTTREERLRRVPALLGLVLAVTVALFLAFEGDAPTSPTAPSVSTRSPEEVQVAALKTEEVDPAGPQVTSDEPTTAARPVSDVSASQPVTAETVLPEIVDRGSKLVEPGAVPIAPTPRPPPPATPPQKPNVPQKPSAGPTGPREPAQPVRPDERQLAYQEGRAKIASEARRDRRAAYERVKFAADRGLPEAELLLGSLFVSGVPDVQEPDDRAALSWYRSAADHGERQARYDLARRLELGRWENASAPGKVCPWWKPFCKATPEPPPAAPPVAIDPEEDLVAWLQSQSPGKGSAAELKEAFALYKALAADGRADAEQRVGYMLAAGHGTERNLFNAFDAFLGAARRGNPSAQFVVGEMYAKGQGIAANPDAAVCWLRKAAAGKIASARRALVVLGKASANGELAQPPRECRFKPFDE